MTDLTMTPVGVSKTSMLPAGANILGVWPATTVLPAQAALSAAVSVLGTPWTLSGMESDLSDMGYNRTHAGVTLAAATSEFNADKVFQVAAGGNAAQLQAVEGSDVDTVISLVQRGDDVIDAAKGAAGAIVDTATTATKAIKYGLYGLIFVGGALIVGGLVFVAVKAGHAVKTAAKEK